MKLLMNEPPLQVQPSLAKIIGLNEALVLQQLHYWLQNKRSKGRVVDGQKWVYNTYEEWVEQFPFFSVSTLRRIFTRLEEELNLIETKQLDANKHDQTKFYRIRYDQIEQLELSNLNNSNYSEWTTDNKKDIDYPETTREEGDLEEQMPLDWVLAHGGTPSQKKLDKAKADEEALIDFERAFGFGTLPWHSDSTWEYFAKWVIRNSADGIWDRYVAWREDDSKTGGKYRAMSNVKIRLNPRTFADTSFPEFALSLEAGSDHREAELRRQGYKRWSDNETTTT